MPVAVNGSGSRTPTASSRCMRPSTHSPAWTPLRRSTTASAVISADARRILSSPAVSTPGRTSIPSRPVRTTPSVFRGATRRSFTARSRPPFDTARTSTTSRHPTVPSSRTAAIAACRCVPSPACPASISVTRSPGTERVFTCSEDRAMYLDTLPPIFAAVGFGALGVGGSMGYEQMRVSVGRKHYEHALSTHPPARVSFNVGGRFASFCCRVALNDTVPLGRSHADFFVVADGRRVAAAEYVVAGSPPRHLVADISGAQVLELSVRTTRWNWSHAVWLDPEVAEIPAVTPEPFVD